MFVAAVAIEIYWKFHGACHPTSMMFASEKRVARRKVTVMAFHSSRTAYMNKLML